MPRAPKVKRTHAGYDSLFEKDVHEAYPVLQRNITRYVVCMHVRQPEMNAVYPKVLPEGISRDTLKFRLRTWTPDWITPSGLIVETKGVWDSEFPHIVLAFRDGYPELFPKLRLIFQAGTNIIHNSRPPYSQSDWCLSNGIIFHDWKRGKSTTIPWLEGLM
jgi:Phage endonuclease I